MRPAERAHNALAPEFIGLAQKLLAPLLPVTQCLVIAQHRGLTADAVQPLASCIHIAQAALIPVLVQHIVPGGFSPWIVGQLAVDMNIGHQPGSPVQPLRNRAQKIWRVAQHTCCHKAGQGHDTALGQPALVLLPAVVPDIQLHAISPICDGKHAAIGVELRGLEPVHQLLRQPAIALRPGQHLLAILIRVEILCRTRRMKAVTTGKVMQARPGRHTVNARAKVVAAAVVQIPEQVFIIQPLLGQPVVKTLRIQTRMRLGQRPFTLPDPDGWHGKCGFGHGGIHAPLKKCVLRKGSRPHTMHRQQAFLPLAAQIQPLLRAMTKIALIVLPAPCNLLSQPKLLQPVLHFLR